MQSAGAAFRYTIDTRKLPPEIAGKVVEFCCDSATAQFVEECKKTPHSRLRLLLCHFLSLALPDYEAHGLLRMFPMFLLDEHRWRALLGGEDSSCALRESLLDIGAGQGFVTRYARGLFRTIVTTETSPAMAKRLRARGFACHAVDIAKYPEVLGGRKFSAVSLLNILDRCAYPLTLLARAVDCMEDDGLLIIADPLPFKPYMRGRACTVPQKEHMPVPESAVWEECLAHFIAHVLVPRGLEVVRLARLPYLYKGSNRIPCHYLDDFVVVCRRKK